MSIYLKSFLGLIAIFAPFVIGTITLAKKQVKFDREKGCTCKHPYIGLISHNCPIHRPFYLFHNIYKIYASFGERIPICSTCLNEILPKGYTVDWPTENNQCHICGGIKVITEIPERDVNTWKNQ